MGDFQDSLARVVSGREDRRGSVYNGGSGMNFRILFTQEELDAAATALGSVGGDPEGPRGATESVRSKMIAAGGEVHKEWVAKGNTWLVDEYPNRWGKFMTAAEVTERMAAGEDALDLAAQIRSHLSMLWSS